MKYGLGVLSVSIRHFLHSTGIIKHHIYSK
jgi:hypothetical protein